MLHKLDAARLEELFEGAENVIWHLNAKSGATKRASFWRTSNQP